jgi:hypothetical protein
MTLLPGPERRMSERVPMTVGLHVYAYGMLVASGTSVDMSEHGVRMRIERSSSDDEFAPGKHLDVVLEHDSTEEWLPIKVVREWEEGIAASFIGVKNPVC